MQELRLPCSHEITHSLLDILRTFDLTEKCVCLNNSLIYTQYHSHPFITQLPVEQSCFTAIIQTLFKSCLLYMQNSLVSQISLILVELNCSRCRTLLFQKNLFAKSQASSTVAFVIDMKRHNYCNGLFREHFSPIVRFLHNELAPLERWHRADNIYLFTPRQSLVQQARLVSRATYYTVNILICG